MPQPEKISQLQALVLDRISTCDYLAAPVPVPLLAEDRNVLETELQQAINEIGIAILVGMPSITNLQPDHRVANVKVSFEIGVGENSIINRDPSSPTATRLPCGDVALGIFQRLHGWQPNAFWAPLRVEQAIPLRDETRQVYELQVSTHRILPPLND